MGYWGWRPLLLAVVISVWVTGCTLKADPIPPDATATNAPPTPQVTLTVGRVRLPVSSPTAPIASPDPAATHSPTPGPTIPPTATPPPVIHTIATGDTLIDIALRYGVELAALRAANANVDLSLLQIGQILIIPAAVPAPGPPAAPSPSAPLLALIVAPPDCYETRAGGVVCLGRIDNPTDQTAERVAVDVRLLQTDGGLAAQAAAAVEQTLIPPQGFAPYRAQFDVPWALYQSLALQARAALQSADAALQPQTRYAAPTVYAASGQLAAGRFIVTAALVNETPGPLTGIRAVVTLLGADGRVIGYRVVTYADQTIAPGEMVDLRVEIVPAAPLLIADYRIYVEARTV